MDSLPVLKEAEKNSIDFMSELQVYQKLKGENLLNIIEILQTENRFYVVYEFPDEMNLQSILDSKGPFPEDKVITLVLDILSAYLPYYKANKLHRNILSKTIYKSNNIYKLLNFPYTESLKTKALSTFFYYKNGISPYEILDSYAAKKLSHKVDVWALGVLFYETIFGVVPFSGKNREDLLEVLENTIKNRKNFFIDLPNPKGIHINADLSDFLEKMLQFEPEDRLNFVQIIEHSFIQKKKKDHLFCICDYFKQTKYDFEKELNVFKGMDRSLLDSLKNCFNLCALDPIKLNELDMLETLQQIPNEFGFSCKLVYKIQFLEDSSQEIQNSPEKKPKLGDFPHKTRAVSQKPLPCGPKNDHDDDLTIEKLDSNEDFQYDDFIKPTSKQIPEKPESISQINLNKFEINLKEIKKEFIDKISHEIEILHFIEHIVPTLNQALDPKDNLNSLISFILTKYLYIRVEFISNCLSKKENLFGLENWEPLALEMNFEKWFDLLEKFSSRVSQVMNNNFHRIKFNEIKDKKLVSFLNFNIDITASDEKMYIRVFLTTILDMKELLEKNNQKILSKFGYGVILKLLYFVSIYEKFGFFKCDKKVEIDLNKMTENVINLDKEKMINETNEFLMTFLQKK